MYPYFMICGNGCFFVLSPLFQCNSRALFNWLLVVVFVPMILAEIIVTKITTDSQRVNSDRLTYLVP